MTIHSTEAVATRTLSLPEEFLLMLLNEESGYFHQVPGWNLNCAIAGAALAELSLQARIDSDTQSLILLDKTPIGNAVLDLVLLQIGNEPDQHSAQFWIERLAPRAEMMIDLTLDRLVQLGFLEHHEGDFWTLARTAWQSDFLASDDEDTAVQFIKTRIGKSIFSGEVPSPRDVIIIGLANTCDVLRFIFELDDEAEDRIRLICQLDLIGRAIADAVTHNLAGPLLRHSSLTKSIPDLPLRRVLMNRHLRNGNIPAGFAEFAEEYGPVFKLSPPFTKSPMYFLAGTRRNRWVHRCGRLYLRSRDYFRDLESAYHASGLIPALDGADHFRMRKVMRPSYARAKLEQHFDTLCHDAQTHMAEWKVGDTLEGVHMCRRFVNAQLSPLFINIDSQDVIDDLIAYKERALTTHVAKVLPKFMLNTPGMKRRAQAIDTVLDRIQHFHTAAQRAGCPRDHADDLLSLHNSDPQFLPESNLRFVLSAPMLASMYAGDELSFMLYAMVTQPDLYEKIRAEADVAFENGNPSPEDLISSAIDVTERFIMECLRLYPTISMSIRTVMNACVVEDFELPVGARVVIAQTASHYMNDVFPDPYAFDIDRYLPSRGEHRTPGYAPFGLGTHSCLGFRLVETQLALSLLTLVHFFEFKISPASYKLKISAFPSMSPNKKLKFTIANRRHELAV